MYLQWQVELQLQEAQDLARSLGATVGLYHDLALGVDPSGADLWAYRNFLVPGLTVGAPPDDFALEGQDWGFHPPNGEQYRNDCYRLFVHEIRKNCRPGGALRIDHIMKFFRLFWIPQGRSAADGTYVEYRSQDLLPILALESQRCKTLVIGEDLGTVPPQVREILRGFSILSYRLFYFERDGSGAFKEPQSYPDHALATVSTHDLPTLAGFWMEQDVHLRNHLGMFPNEADFQSALRQRKTDKEHIVQRLVASGFISEKKVATPAIYGEFTDDIHEAIVGFILSTPAKLAVLSQEDLFKDIRQQNVPGTVSEHHNWSTKMKYSLEELWHDTTAQHCARLFRLWVDRSGRNVLASSQ
jgi:4-alpha-glucanotransferase